LWLIDGLSRKEFEGKGRRCLNGEEFVDGMTEYAICEGELSGGDGLYGINVPSGKTGSGHGCALSQAGLSGKI
jgi:hypothetical protein